MKNYYQVTFDSFERNGTETVGVRAHNMPSALKAVKDAYEESFELEFIKVEMDNTVRETIDTNFKIDL